MQFSEQWLREYTNPAIDTNALSHLLTMAGLEVEGLDSVLAQKSILMPIDCNCLK